MEHAERSAGHRRGLVLAAVAAALWGFGGIAAQQLFTHHSVTPDWLVSVRMSGAGLLLLAVLRPAWPGRHWPRLLAVALPGMAATQYTWFAAIQHSNAATATFLQYTGLAMTAGWQLLRRQIRATPLRLTAIALAATGAGLLVLGAGGFSALRLDPLGTVLALLSAVSYSYCMIASVRLVRELGAGALTAWGLTVCGLAMLPVTRPWQAHPTGSGGAVLALTLFVTVGATAVACTLSLAALNRISPTESAVTSTLEPAVSGAVAAVYLGVTLMPLQYLGAALTLAAVVLLALSERDRDPGRGRERVRDLDRELLRGSPAATPAPTSARPRS